MLARSGASAVLDLSEFTMGETAKFTAAFAEAFFLAKRSHKSPVSVFWEEAQTFAPQELPPDPHAALMLNRVVRLVKVGRNYGIGNVLITQEPQAVSKRALGQVNCLFIGRMQGPKARKAIAEWLDDKATRAGDLDIVQELTTLEQGDAYVAEPKWFGAPRRIHVLEKTTFDSSATPRFGQAQAKPGKLADVDLHDLKAGLAEMVATAEKDDPVALRRRIHELEVEAKKRPGAPAPPAPKPPKRVDVPALTPAQIHRLTSSVEKMAKSIALVVGASADLREGLAAVAGAAAPKLHALPPRRATDPIPIHTRSPVVRPATAVPADPEGLPLSGRKVLEAVAMRHPDGVTMKQLATIAGYKPSGGGFLNIVSNLNARGLITKRGDLRHLTDAGVAFFGAELPKPPAGDALREMWRGKLQPTPRKVFDAVVAVYPGAVSRGDLAAQLGYAADGGGFLNTISMLSARGIVQRTAEGLRASDDLFEGAR